MKGKKAVEKAIEFLQRRGFTTSDAREESANGHDIVAIKKGRGFTFEVKPAVFKSRSYRTSRVVCTKSDGIIVVFPNGEIFLDSMANHLKNCSKCGNRFLTFIGQVCE